MFRFANNALLEDDISVRVREQKMNKRSKANTKPSFDGNPGHHSTFNSLPTVGYLLEVFIKLWIPSMVHIFTSAWS